MLLGSSHSPSPDRGPRHLLLIEDHRRLEGLFAEMLEAAEAGVDSRTLGVLWTRLERGVLAHLQGEESELFGALEGRHPEMIRALRKEHHQIRELLSELDVEVDLHFLRAPRVARFIALWRSHAAREDASLYRWADVELP
jgi:hemerythrin superfamily protein